MVDINKEYVLHGPELCESVPTESYGITVYKYLQENYNLPIAMIDPVTRKHVSYKSLFEEAKRLAYSLHNYGITENDVVAISSENSVYYPVPFIATLWLGATVTLFNPLYTIREVLHVSNISKPTIVFCSKVSQDTILQAQKELKFSQKIITLEDCNPEVESMAYFMSLNSRGYTHFEPVDVDIQKVALILYSSGTTGLPKGVMLTHNNLNVGALFLKDSRFFMQRPPGTAVSMCLIPMFHAFGLVVFITALLFARISLIMSKFDPLLYLKSIQDYKIKSLSIVPPIANFLANSELTSRYDMSHVDVITSGAAPLSKHVEDVLLTKFKNVSHVRQGYGLTEATFATIISPTSGAKPSSIGKLLPGTSAKVVDVNTGRSLGPGLRGELWFKGGQIMKGYVGDVASTSSAFDKDGWLKTGDVGYFDAEENFYIVDRLKELIKYKAYQVPPAELEALLLEHPKIADAAVIGIPDETAGEVPLAFVIKKPRQNVTEADVKDYVAERVAPSKYLRGGVRFVDDIPKNPSGKILRSQLRQMLSNKSKL